MSKSSVPKVSALKDMMQQLDEMRKSLVGHRVTVGWLDTPPQQGIIVKISLDDRTFDFLNKRGHTEDAEFDQVIRLGKHVKVK